MEYGNKIKGGTKLSLRFLWYLGASILILSLPTFSYLVPRVDPPSDSRMVEETPRPTASVGKRSVSDRTPSGRGFVRPPSAGRASAGSSGKRITKPPERRPRPDRRQARQPSSPRAKPEQTERAEQPGDQAGETSPRSQPISGVAPGSLPPIQAAMAQELQQLQQDYEQVQQNLFPQLALGLGPSRGNPFQEAIENDPPPAADPAPDTPPAEDPPPTDAVDEVGTDTPEPEPTDPLPDVGSGGDSQPDPYDFLITGHFSDAPTRVWRARRDSATEFSLEDSGTVNFFPGFIGSFVTFDTRDKILIADLNDDGVDDFVVARLASGVGTVVESYLGSERGRFELHAATILYLRAVRSLALFDFDNNGEDELALLLEGQPHLFVYERDQQDWLYRREIVLPWPAGMLVKSAVGAAPRSINLYILDNALQSVVAISSRAPSAFVHGARAPLSFQRSIDVEFLAGKGRDESQVMGLLMPDQVVLMERNDNGLDPFVSVGQADQRMPTMIIGDYSGLGKRQVIWIP